MFLIYVVVIFWLNGMNISQKTVKLFKMTLFSYNIDIL